MRVASNISRIASWVIGDNMVIEFQLMTDIISRCKHYLGVVSVCSHVVTDVVTLAEDVRMDSVTESGQVVR